MSLKCTGAAVGLENCSSHSRKDIDQWYLAGGGWGKGGISGSGGGAVAAVVALGGGDNRR